MRFSARFLGVVGLLAFAGAAPAFSQYPAGAPLPLASAIDFGAGQTRANNAVVRLGTAGGIAVRCDMPAGSGSQTHFILDVTGYFE
jgi:hypothetical protein